MHKTMTYTLFVSYFVNVCMSSMRVSNCRSLEEWRVSGMMSLLCSHRCFRMHDILVYKDFV